MGAGRDRERRYDYPTQEQLDKRKTKAALILELQALRKQVVMKQDAWGHLRQKWVAAVDEFNECRWDCEPARLMAA